MNYLNIQILDAAVRVGQYNADHPLATPIARATVLFTELGAVANDMRTYHTAQATGLTGFRGGAGERRAAFFSLLGEMRVLNTIARGVDPVEFPALAEQFRMPYSRSYANIAAFGRAFAANAVGQEAVFTDRGLPAGFFPAFTAKADAAEAAVEGRNTGLINRSGATAGIAYKGRRALAIIRELNAIMVTALRDDPVQLAAWKTAKRVARRARSSGTTPPPEPGSGS